MQMRNLKPRGVMLPTGSLTYVTHVQQEPRPPLPVSWPRPLCLLQRASCSLETISPTSATFQATSCAAMGGASPAPGSVTGCPTASTRVTRRSAVSGLALQGGVGEIPGQRGGRPDPAQTRHTAPRASRPTLSTPQLCLGAAWSVQRQEPWWGQSRSLRRTEVPSTRLF